METIEKFCLDDATHRQRRQTLLHKPGTQWRQQFSSYMSHADEWKSYFRLTALFLFIATIISEETDTCRVYLLEETVINIRWRQGKRGDS